MSDWAARLGADEVVRHTAAEAIDVLFISLLMLRSALAVANVRTRLEDIDSDVLVVVGGAPFRFDPGLGCDVRADFVGESATDVPPIMARIERERQVNPQ